MAKKVDNLTTDKDYKIFQEEAKYWIRYFGLYSYRFSFSHQEIGDGSCAASQVNKDRSNKCCVLALEINWKDNKVSDFEIRKSAFHEVLEIMFWEIGDLLHSNVGEFVERKALHEIIRIMENTVFNDSYLKRFENDRAKSKA